MDILQMSISAGILVVAIVIIRGIALNRLPKNMFLTLWGIALFRMLVPFSIPSRYNFYSIMRSIFKSNTSTALVPQVDKVILSGMPTTGTVQPIEPMIQKHFFSVSPITVIWFIGMLAMFIFFIIIFYKNHMDLCDALPIRDNEFLDNWSLEHKTMRPIRIMQSDRITTPLAVGLVKPRIILPKSMPMRDTQLLEYVLQHEYYHIRRFDMLWKLLVVMSLCIHWFNPMMWVMFVLVNRDLELTCDVMVMHHFGTETKTAYAYSIIGMVEQRRKFAPLYTGFGKNAIEERIVSIMKSKKNSLIGIIMAGVLVIGATAVFATNAVAKSSDSSTEKGITKTDIIKSAVITSSNESGVNMISTDNGESWQSEAEYGEVYSNSDIDWWTYDEYKEWLENEKIQLQDMIGEKGWNPTDGWYTLTQEKVDATIKMYEKTLEDIKNGLAISKTVDGSDQTVISYDPSNVEVSKGYEIYLIHGKGTQKQIGPYDTREELYTHVRSYCEEQVKAGNMTQQEADEILGMYDQDEN